MGCIVTLSVITECVITLSVIMECVIITECVTTLGNGRVCFMFAVMMGCYYTLSNNWVCCYTLSNNAVYYTR